MGIDIHSLNFLRYNKKFSPLLRVLTIGRQGLHIPDDKLIRLLNLNRNYIKHEYCESLLKSEFGALSVDSIDHSSFEGATIIHDLNKPLINVFDKFDTIIDGGCLEHIYNIPQALKNISDLCNPGGTIMHMVPANNFCGHGFWQFSPELFYTLYSEKNGYINTEVFFANVVDNKNWYLVKKPSDGHRVNLSSYTEVYLLVRTTLISHNFCHDDIQQSDYIYEWSGIKKNIVHVKPGFLAKIKEYVKESLIYSLFSPLYHFSLHLFSNSNRLNIYNNNLNKLKIEKLINEFR